MYNLWKKLNLTPPPLTTVDTPLCLTPGVKTRREHTMEEINTYWLNHYPYHRHSMCHALSRAAFLKQNPTTVLKYPDANYCKTSQMTDHCECYVVPLHMRLKDSGWIPANLKYCHKCRKFTRRLAKNKNRCKYLTIHRLFWRSLVLSEKLLMWWC
jgi:hypothetical protein